MTGLPLRVRKGDHDAPIEPLRERTIVVLGYGNQGRANALNLRDSGQNVLIGAREGPGADAAQRDGFSVAGLGAASALADLIIVALPDEVQPEVLAGISQILRPHAIIGFLHGFNIRYGLVQIPQDHAVILVAPKGPGTTLRRTYLEGRGIPSLVAIHQPGSGPDAMAIALAWANGIGSARAGIIETSFAAETETDLFGEQAVLCGGLLALCRAAFEIMTRNGYPPELAYIECIHEVKQVADLLYARGPSGMCDAISNTAEFGAYEAIKSIDDEHLRRQMVAMLDLIRSGVFAQRLREDYDAGSIRLQSNRRSLESHPMEEAGRAVRSLMPWLSNP